MKITRTYKGRESVFDRETDSVIVGRPRQGIKVDIDLTPDQGASRPHARIWIDDGRFWIEDLNSANGTIVDDEVIQGKTELKPGQTIRISQSTLNVDTSQLDDAEAETIEPAPGSPKLRLDIRQMIDASRPAFTLSADDNSAARKLAFLYELPLKLAGEGDLDSLLQTITERVVEVVPNATRGALLLRDPANNLLLPKGTVPLGQPAISETLINRAINERQAFVWHRGPDLTTSQGEFHIESGMYAPLTWKDETLGVLCVDNEHGGPAFEEEDLRLLTAVAHHVTLAAVRNRLQEDLRRNAALLSRLMPNFSPRIRERLLARARHGRLRLGGEKSDVVILISDIRGFTLLTRDMETDEIVDLLNEYLSALVDTVFRFDGTVDKFIGDSILVVFGSPEPDPQMYEKAIRASVAMQAAAAQVTGRRSERHQPICKIGIGVHCGEVLHGFIGSDERMEFTVIGSPVNITSRYAAGAGEDEILISREMWQRCYRLLETELVTIRTKHENDFQAFKVKGIRNTGKL